MTQLLVNWRTWYSGGGTMFEMGAEMLAREGYQLPEPTRMQDGSETPRGTPSAAGGAGMPVLLGQVGGGGLSVAAAAAAPSAAQTAAGRALTDASLAAEMAVTLTLPLPLTLTLTLTLTLILTLTLPLTLPLPLTLTR